jgi:hypothetical protein
MQPMHIYDSDELYRSVREGEYKTINGKVAFSASAFNDRERKPSVDTSSIRRDPRECRKSPDQGVTKLVAHEVRSARKIPIYDAKQKVIGEHSVDVLHRPIQDDPGGEPDNLAHCQVECHPTIDNDNRFKRLKEALAAMANKYGWVIEPGSV